VPCIRRRQPGLQAMQDVQHADWLSCGESP
jgi:hypothetical protein